MLYRHTQIGYLMIVILGIGLLFVLGRPWSLLGIVILAASMALFPTLTIEIIDNSLVWYFGLGLIRKNVALSEIERVTVVRNHWLQSWGIHRIGSGWLKNVSGFDAVEIRLNNGRVIRLGTDRAGELAGILDAAISRQAVISASPDNGGTPPQIPKSAS